MSHVMHRRTRSGPGRMGSCCWHRDPNDIVLYPRSNKIHWRAVRVIARIERLDHWDGEL